VNVALELFLLALIAGAGLPVQATFNAALAREAGGADWAAFANFAIGTLLLGLWLAARRAPDLGLEVRPLTGVRALGAALLVAGVFLVRR
jgi:uncharacterized membrane protein YdcZ (DUF606 family)